MAEKSRKPKIRFAGFTEAWEQRKAKDLGRFSKGCGYSKADLIPNGTPIILYGRLYTNYQSTISEVDTYALKKKNSILSKGNEVVVPASGETAEDIARASAIIKRGVILGGDLNIIEPLPSINPEFLALSISNGYPQKVLAQKAQGKSVVHIHNSDIQDLPIAYPLREEQNNIAGLFRHLDRLITLHQRKRDRLGNIKKAMLEKMFPKNGADVPEVRFAGFTEAWEQRKLGELLVESKIKGHSGNVAKKLTVKLWGKGVVEKNDFGGSVYTQYYIRKYEQFIYSKLDFLNSAFAVIPRNMDGYESTADLPAFDCMNSNPYFIFYKVTQKDFYLKNGAVADGSRKAKRIHVDTFLGMGINVPNLLEQDKIVQFFQVLDHLITLHQRKVELLQNIKKACLETMFV